VDPDTPKTSEKKPKVKRYRLVMEKKDWHAATCHCQILHPTAHLVVIRNAHEQKEITRYLRKYHRKQLSSLIMCCHKLR